MFFIAHRGNFEGSSIDENSPQRIEKALAANYHVEFDLWIKKNGWWLGHDSPFYNVSAKFVESLPQQKLWVHAKNLKALQTLLEMKVQCFWHQEDDFTLTSSGVIWTYPEKKVCVNSIIVCRTNKELKNVVNENVAIGVCADDFRSVR